MNKSYFGGNCMIKTWVGPSDKNNEMIEQLKSGVHLLVINASTLEQVIIATVINGVCSCDYFTVGDNEDVFHYTPHEIDEHQENVSVQDLLEADCTFIVKQFI
ncbi:MAG: hypothetical protein ACTSPI_00430 [Candidatus Heimdallarchaeaceae archaeon]